MPRALGGGRRADADALVLHAIIVNLALGVAFSALVLAYGSSLYRALGGDGASLSRVPYSWPALLLPGMPESASNRNPS